MAVSFNSLLFLCLLLSFLSQISSQNATSSVSFSFPLHSLPRSPKSSAPFAASLASRNPPVYNFRSKFQYSMALIVSLPIGTPPQTQQMLLDTGSQLSWIQCHQKAAPTTPAFDPSRSSSFSVLPCTHPLCKPRIPDFTLPTTCDQNRLCHYSYFYADGTYAEGSLVREKFTFSPSLSTPPLILGCAQDSSDEKGILGMNLGRRSFVSQAGISKFSYCVPTRRTRAGLSATGSFYLGENPNSHGFQYVNLLTFSSSQRSPNLDPLAYTVPLQGIRIGNRRLDIPASAFRPDPSGAGQTIVDSGSEFTYLVDEAYNKVREEMVKRVGPMLKKGYVYSGVADMCFDGNPFVIGRSIGDLVFEFEKGVEIVVSKYRVLSSVGNGVHCVGIGRSEILGAASNIIGNVHQQNLWVEFDVANRRMGFAAADCSKASVGP